LRNMVFVRNTSRQELEMVSPRLEPQSSHKARMHDKKERKVYDKKVVLFFE
jgi:hypothetical protein